MPKNGDKVVQKNDRLNAGFWMGLALALLGAAFVLGQDLVQATRLGLGTFLGLFAAFFYGAYYLVTQRGRTHLDTLSYFWITVASSSIVLLLINVALGRPRTGYDAATYWNFLALGLFAEARDDFSVFRARELGAHDVCASQPFDSTASTTSGMWVDTPTNRPASRMRFKRSRITSSFPCLKRLSVTSP